MGKLPPKADTQRIFFWFIVDVFLSETTYEKTNTGYANITCSILLFRLSINLSALQKPDNEVNEQEAIFLIYR